MFTVCWIHRSNISTDDPAKSGTSRVRRWTQKVTLINPKLVDLGSTNTGWNSPASIKRSAARWWRVTSAAPNYRMSGIGLTDALQLFKDKGICSDLQEKDWTASWESLQRPWSWWGKFCIHIPHTISLSWTSCSLYSFYKISVLFHVLDSLFCFYHH